ncbi:MAG: ASKHA domain-containing protein [Anaerolineae bacterium]
MASIPDVRVVFRPAGRAVRVPRGTLLNAAANQVGVAVEQVCGGRGTCGKCKVRVLKGDVTPAGEGERRHLSPAELAQGIRLACQTEVLSDAEVEISWASATAGISILVEGQRETLTIDPVVTKTAVRVPEANLADQVADHEALQRVLVPPEGETSRPTLQALKEMPEAVRAQGGLLTAVRAGGLLLAVEPGDTTQTLYGFACDIGTTTVVGYLLDLVTGERLGVASTLNPQTRFGDDVVSRIDVASRDAAGLEALRAAIVQAIDELIGQVASQAGIARERIYALSFVGNTCMHHLFLGLSPASLGRSPYVPVVASPLQVDAEELGLHAHPSAQAYVLPNIAGFVGADTVGVLLATRLLHKDGIRLAIDIGTNGEMALGSSERMLVCSTAAGPAFEGAQLTFGMRAADGAIDHVAFAGDDISIQALGYGKLRGICGSGAVDVVATLRQLGIIDPSGRFVSREEVAARHGERLAARIVNHGTGAAFLLAPGELTANGQPIVFTQRDIRQLQLGKGAIRAGVEMLMQGLGVAPEQVTEVCLAGAFGNYIAPESALEIGLLPRFPNAPITPVGNAAGTGAQMALLSRAAWREAAEIRTRVEYIELSLHPDFQQIFMDSMMM